MSLDRLPQALDELQASIELVKECLKHSHDYKSVKVSKINASNNDDNQSSIRNNNIYQPSKKRKQELTVENETIDDLSQQTKILKTNLSNYSETSNLTKVLMSSIVNIKVSLHDGKESKSYFVHEHVLKKLPYFEANMLPQWNVNKLSEEIGYKSLNIKLPEEVGYTSFEMLLFVLYNDKFPILSQDQCSDILLQHIFELMLLLDMFLAIEIFKDVLMQQLSLVLKSASKNSISRLFAIRIKLPNSMNTLLKNFSESEMNDTETEYITSLLDKIIGDGDDYERLQFFSKEDFDDDGNLLEPEVNTDNSIALNMLNVLKKKLHLREAIGLGTHDAELVLLHLKKCVWSYSKITYYGKRNGGKNFHFSLPKYLYQVWCSIKHHVTSATLYEHCILLFDRFRKCMTEFQPSSYDQYNEIFIENAPKTFRCIYEDIVLIGVNLVNEDAVPFDSLTKLMEWNKKEKFIYSKHYRRPIDIERVFTSNQCDALVSKMLKAAKPKVIHEIAKLLLSPKFDFLFSKLTQSDTIKLLCDSM
jgi:hypothetical protein